MKWDWVLANPFLITSLGLAALLLVVIGLWVRATMRVFRLEAQVAQEEEQLNRFKVLAQEAVQGAQDGFMTLAQERFQNWQTQAGGDLDKRQKAIADMVKPVDEQLKTLKSVMEQMKGTDESLRDHLKTLGSETARIAGAMKNPQQRGKWGEYILDRLLEKSGLVKGVHYKTQESMIGTDGNTQYPDVVIQLQEGLQIIVDSKAPIQDVLADLDNPDTAVQAREALAKSLRGHIDALSKKDYGGMSDESPDFVVLFLPGEHLYSTALMADRDLIDYAAGKNIVVASPMLMLALARVVHMGWRQFELGKHAREIAAQGAELHGRINSFMEHYLKVGKALNGAAETYNKSIGSMERKVVPQLRRIEEMQVVQPGKEVKDPAMVESVAREVAND